MKRVILANAVKQYQNNRNPNKFVEVKKGNDGHSYIRQYMEWDTDNGTIKNYNGAKSRNGRYHRATQKTINQILEDYTEVTAASFRGIKYKYGVHYIGSDGRDILCGGSKSKTNANEMAKRAANHLFSSLWVDAESKFKLLDSIYVINEDTEEEAMTYDTEEYIDNLMSQLDSEIS